MAKSKNIINLVLKVVLSLLLITPLFGALGIFPEPTRDMYNTDEAFNFIQMMMQSATYIQYGMVLVFIACVFLLWTGREAFSALLLAPITFNVVGFHLFLDGGLFTAGAVLGNVLLLLNVYFLWQNRAQYSSLLTKR